MDKYVVSKVNIVDGSGSPLYKGTIVMEGDRFSYVGPESINPEGCLQIDGDGLYACPGFIDMHSHSSLAYMANPGVDAKTHQGVTSEVMGVDGLSVYPIRPEGVPDWRTHLSGLEGNPSIQWSWGNLKEYIRGLPRTGTNPVPLAGHGSIRYYVMGMEQRSAEARELEQMGRLLEECFDSGAWGLSTGLIYSPCTYADARELEFLTGIAARYNGIFVVHLRDEGAGVLESIDEVAKIGSRAGCRVHISHLKAMGEQARGKAAEICDRIGRLRKEGMDITADQYPYTAGSTMLAAILPSWLHSAGPAGMKKILSDPAQIEKMTAGRGFDGGDGGMMANIYISSVASDKNNWAVGNSLTQIAAEWGLKPFEAAVRLLLEEDFAVGMIIFLMDEGDVEQIMKAEWVMFCTDGLLSGKPHPRTYGAFARILEEYVRKRRIISLEEAVRKGTLLTAQTLGLKERGRLMENNFADLCLFNFDQVADLATYGDPAVHPGGIKHVFVNGVPVIRDGQKTGSRTGTPLLKT